MKRVLILADGSVFEGTAIGADGETTGEVVFTTAMVGYMETLTDPRYYGQIVTQTFPLIGNYGATELDADAEKPALRGYIVREECEIGSNFRKKSELDEFLKRNGIVGIAGIDTRSLTKKLRENGVMNGMLTFETKNLEGKLKTVRAYKVSKAVESTASAEPRESNGGGGPHAVVWDFGAEKEIEREMIRRGCRVTRMPALSGAREILEQNPDGIVLSPGGGDPAENVRVIEELKKLNEKELPTFGIGLGHQLLAISRGAKTKKLKYGHRGASQPVKNTRTGKVFVTAQNHGYAVAEKSLPESAVVSYTNANDRTCEGIEYNDCPAFSVQFFPVSCGCPLDTVDLFDGFVDLMKKNAGGKKNA